MSVWGHEEEEEEEGEEVGADADNDGGKVVDAARSEIRRRRRQPRTSAPIAPVSVDTSWVLLRFAPIGSARWYSCSYLDHRGRAHEAQMSPGSPGSLSILDSDTQLGLVWPTEATTDLIELIGSTPVSRPQVSGSVPIAVIVTGPDELESSDLERATETLLDRLGVARSKFSLSSLTSGRRPDRPVTLPLRVAVGPRQNRLSAKLKQRFGRAISLERFDIAPSGQAEGVDVAFIDATDVQSIASWRHVPRLLVVEYPPNSPYRGPLPRGASMIFVPRGQATATMPLEILTEISHNHPLHEAVVYAGRKLGLDVPGRRRVSVVTTPEGIDEFRLDRILDDLRSRTLNLAPYRRVLSEPVLPPRETTPALDAEAQAVIHRAIESGSQLVDDFRRESIGMIPMSESVQLVESAETIVRHVRSARNPRQVQRMDERLQKRRPTVWVSSEDRGVGGMAQNDRLALAGSYTLNVGVGIAWKNDLVPTTAASVDQALPPTGRPIDLDVAVFSGSASFVGATRASIRLPLIGGSSVAQFRFTTPTSGRSTDIRIGLYCRGHLIQMLNLHAKLASVQLSADHGVGMRITVLFARTTEIADLSRFERRPLAVAANASNGGTQHRLMFGTGDGIPFTEAQLAPIQQLYRQRLAKIFDMRTSKFKVADLEALLRDMANEGSKLHNVIYDAASDDLKGQLDEVSDSPGPLTIQYVRVQPTLSFPWEALYDWSISPVSDVRARTPVCLGAVPGGGQCAHTASDDIICVRGFWGVRHVIEEFLKATSEQGPIARVVAIGPAPPLAYTFGISDPWTKQLETRLGTMLGSSVEAIVKPDSLFAHLDSVSRPAALVVLGHLSNKPLGNLPDPPRIEINASEVHLYPRAPQWRALALRDRWAAPNRPIVFLLACGSAIADLTKLPEFLVRLAGSGASAVIATEERIDTALAADVTEYVIARLDTTGPGESLRAWRAESLTKGNPSGFLVRCFGNAHVTAQLATTPTSN